MHSQHILIKKNNKLGKKKQLSFRKGRIKEISDNIKKK